MLSLNTDRARELWGDLFTFIPILDAGFDS